MQACPGLWLLMAFSVLCEDKQREGGKLAS